MSVYVMKKLKQFILFLWNYFRNSWEGDDGKFSYKRASQYLFLWLMVIMILRDKIQSQYGYKTFVILSILFALTAVIITVPQLITLLGEYSDIKKTEAQNNLYGDFNQINKADDSSDVPEVKLPE